MDPNAFVSFLHLALSYSLCTYRCPITFALSIVLSFKHLPLSSALAAFLVNLCIICFIRRRQLTQPLRPRQIIIKFSFNPKKGFLCFPYRKYCMCPFLLMSYSSYIIHFSFIYTGMSSKKIKKQRINGIVQQQRRVKRDTN
jgi:hypothetical protein